MALTVGLVCAALLLLADAMQAHEELLSIDELLGLFSAIALSYLRMLEFCAGPSVIFVHALMCVLVPSGGQILETCLDTLATPYSHDVWRKHCRFVKAHGMCKMPNDDFAAVSKKGAL